jgi:hypothetical protein
MTEYDGEKKPILKKVTRIKKDRKKRYERGGGGRGLGGSSDSKRGIVICTSC